MKRIMLFLLVSIVGCSAASAQTAPSPAQAGVQAAVTGVFEALAQLDVSRMKTFCSPGVTILESGKIWTMDTLESLVNNIKSTTQGFKRANTLHFLDTRIFAETAWVYYDNQAVVTVNGSTTTLHWLESAFLQRQGSAWKISLLHSTTLHP